MSGAPFEVNSGGSPRVAAWHEHPGLRAAAKLVGGWQRKELSKGCYPGRSGLGVGLMGDPGWEHGASPPRVESLNPIAIPGGAIFRGDFQKPPQDLDAPAQSRFPACFDTVHSR